MYYTTVHTHCINCGAKKKCSMSFASTPTIDDIDRGEVEFEMVVECAFCGEFDIALSTVTGGHCSTRFCVCRMRASSSERARWELDS